MLRGALLDPSVFFSLCLCPISFCCTIYSILWGKQYKPLVPLFLINFTILEGAQPVLVLRAQGYSFCISGQHFRNTDPTE